MSTLTPRTFVGKVVRRIAARLDAWHRRLLRTPERPALTANERRDAHRLELLVHLYEMGRLPTAVVPETLDENGELAVPTVPKIRRVRQEVVQFGDEHGLFAALAAHEPVEPALIDVVRAACRRGAPTPFRRARAVAQSLQDRPATAHLGDIAMAVIALTDRVPTTAWELLNRVDRDTVLRLAPGEFFRAGAAVDPERSVEVFGSVMTGEIVIDTDAWSWLSIAKSLFRDDEAGSAFALDRARQSADPADSELAVEIAWLEDWYGRDPGRSSAPAPSPGTIPFAVLDYKQPDRSRASLNLGDYVQTISSLGHVVRHSNVTFTGDVSLVGIADKLQARVRPDRRLDSAAATLELHRIDRDASPYSDVPDGTWALMFGWYMYPMFDLDFNVPFHPNLRPIFISFHVNDSEMLTPDMVDYLRRYAPVGCRDWNTVHLLSAAGVPAFFSGCLTSTVDTVFPPAPDAAGEGTVFVDVRTTEGPYVTQVYDAVRERPMAPNVDDALDLLESYRSDYAKVVTSRLHCYMPARSLGADVDFRPHNRSDVRFDGLAGISDVEFDQLRSGILDKLAAVMSAIVAGQGEDEVYAIWREVCAPAVAEAESLRASIGEIPPPTFDLAEACRVVHDRSRTIERSEAGPDGDEIHVEVSLDGNLKDQLDVVLESIVSRCSRPIRLYVLCRDHDDTDFERVAALFPTVSFVWLPTDEVDYGRIIGMISHITVATMDRLLLPDLLPDLPKIVHHDLDALCLGDLAELFDVDVSHTRLAARTSPQPGPGSGFWNFTRSATRLTKDPDMARELIVRSHTMHAFDFAAFNAGILVLNLDRMRADRFCRLFLPWAERYGMNDQEILNAYAGADRVELDADWNRLPRLEMLHAPKIVHWAGAQKPWRRDQYVQYRDAWDEVEARVRARAAAP